MDTLISNVTVVTMNGKMDVLFGHYLGIADGKICYLSPNAPEKKPATIIDGTGMVAMPGLINCHTHLATTGLRGLFDDLSRQESLVQLLQKEAKMDSRCAKACALLGIAECLRFGITSVSDLYYYPDATAEAAAESGIKANVALSAYRFEDATEEFDFEKDLQCQEFVRVAEKWHGYDNARIRVDGGIYAEYTSNHLLWEAISDYAKENGLSMQLHLSETQEEVDGCMDRTGLSPVALLNCHRVFAPSTLAAGCACLSEDDRKILSAHQVTAVATPIANAKMGLTQMPIADCVKSGMNVALGTGGACECANLDMFEQMRFAACASRAAGGDASAMPSSAVLMMATFCGARSQGRADECGTLELGKDADLILVDFSAPHLIPCHNVLNGLVFSAKGGDVAMTMVRGKILYQSGHFPTIDLNAVVQQLQSYVLPRLFSGKE